MTACDGPACERRLKKLPKRGFVLTTGRGKRYRFCSLRCLELALLAGLGKCWLPAPSGRKRDFGDSYWRGYLKRCSAINPATLSPPWPRSYEDCLLAIAQLRDAIRPGFLDRLLAAVAKEIRAGAKRDVEAELSRLRAKHGDRR